MGGAANNVLDLAHDRRDGVEKIPPSPRRRAVLGQRWWLQTAKQEEDRISHRCCHVFYGRSVLSAQMLEAFLSGVGTALPPSRNRCVVNGQMTKAKQQMSTPLLPLPPPTHTTRQGLPRKWF